MKESGLYIHIPFCRSKCLYCDFYAGGERIVNWKEMISSLLNELKERSNELITPPTTLYIGGGTPSLIPDSQLFELIEGISSIYGISNWGEFTIEVNPEDVTFQKIKTWVKAGINRISLGVQTLNDNELKAIHRNHDASTAKKSIELLLNNFNNVSVDVMFGLPEQTLNSYQRSLQEICDYQPTHISSYSLMLEKGTAMTLLVSQNKIKLPNEEEWLSMFNYTHYYLKEKGYIRYEISNYALPGYESKHNNFYWKGNPYLGLGPAAHSYDGKLIRRFNPADIKGYIHRFSNMESLYKTNFFDEEKLSNNEIKEEFIMTRLRTIDGISLKEYNDKFGEKEKINLLQKARYFIDSGALKEENEKLSFTESGFLISDTVLSTLF